MLHTALFYRNAKAALFFQDLHDFGKVLFGLPIVGQHTVAMHHAGTGRDRIGNVCPPAGILEFRPRAVEDFVCAVIEMYIAHAGVIAQGGGRAYSPAHGSGHGA